jgi:biopolymer transport protein ExbB
MMKTRGYCRRAAARLLAVWALIGLWGAADHSCGAVPATPAGDPGVQPAAVTNAQDPANGGPVTDREPIPTKDLWSIMREGGPLMVPIGLCSFILVAFVFERTISLRRGRVIPRPFVRRFLKQLRESELNRQRALALCQESRSPVAEVFAGAVRKWGRPAVEVEQGIIDSGERVTNGLRRYLRVINGVATVSPLLGLLGTVLGMIRAFNNIATADALGRPELLAKGISEALLTTAAGLTVAIPALIFYLFFVSRVDRLIIEIDAMGQEVVNTISAEQLQDPQQRAAKPRRDSRRGAA